MPPALLISALFILFHHPDAPNLSTGSPVKKRISSNQIIFLAGTAALSTVLFAFDAASIGLCAAFLTTGSFSLQVFDILKTRETRAISTKMYLVFISGLLLWLTYGIKSGDIPLIAANGVTLLLASAVMALKWNNERARD